MRGSIFVITMFSNYYACLNELTIINQMREEFINSLPGASIKGISFEDSPGSTAISYMQSTNSDYIDEWDRKHKKIIDFCENIVNTCDSWLSLMCPDTKKIFIMRFVENKTVEEIANIVGYTKSGLSKKIRQECFNVEIV